MFKYTIDDHLSFNWIGQCLEIVKKHVLEKSKIGITSSRSEWVGFEFWLAHSAKDGEIGLKKKKLMIKLELLKNSMLANSANAPPRKCKETK